VAVSFWGTVDVHVRELQRRADVVRDDVPGLPRLPALLVDVGAEPEVAGDEHAVTFAERVGHVPGLLVEHDDMVEHGAGVLPRAGGLVGAAVVDGDGEAGVLVARFAGAVFGVTGEVALDGDRDSGGHPSSFRFGRHPWCLVGVGPCSPRVPFLLIGDSAASNGMICTARTWPSNPPATRRAAGAAAGSGWVTATTAWSARIADRSSRCRRASSRRAADSVDPELGRVGMTSW
jgi:hypothetical protein